MFSFRPEALQVHSRSLFVFVVCIPVCVHACALLHMHGVIVLLEAPALVHANQRFH